MHNLTTTFYVRPFVPLFSDVFFKEEFRRITTFSLEQHFIYKLDQYTPKRITLMKAKGGVVATKLRTFLDKLSEACLFYSVLIHMFW